MGPTLQVFWLLGTTPLLVSSVTVLILLLLSDVIFVPMRGKGRDAALGPGGSHDGGAAREQAPFPAASAVSYPAAPPV